MRNETDMYHLFMEIANTDARILAVYMNGSRTNHNVPKDIFQDYDIVFVVTSTQPFIDDKDWILRFGTILYMQYPDEHPDYPNDKENFYGWLMQFDDGVRVDLHVESLSHARVHIHDDKLCRVLLDKGNILPPIPEATDEDYHVQKPSEEQFKACANEFWWCTNNLAKGLWREEMPYVQDMANSIVRKQLEQMLSWKAGIRTGFAVSVGKSAKYLYRWLDSDEYQRYLDTYFKGVAKDAWEAVLLMCEMFDQTARELACAFGYAYDDGEGEAAFAFLKHVKQLPKDASDIGHVEK
ncbi:MAG: aminoglycoside 6-adenylyltransferase [Lachnospiraceae bacterium]|nr:aminoglycoside 6-adenylyltransferase [Lachnospiraceae bacterium]